MYEVLQNHPEFKKDLLSYTFDEERHKTTRQSFAYRDIELLSLSSILADFKRASAALRTMIQFVPSTVVKYSVGNSLFNSVLQSLGTERHSDILSESEEGNVIYLISNFN